MALDCRILASATGRGFLNASVTNDDYDYDFFATLRVVRSTYLTLQKTSSVSQ